MSFNDEPAGINTANRANKLRGKASVLYAVGTRFESQMLIDYND